MSSEVNVAANVAKASIVNERVCKNISIVDVVESVVGFVWIVHKARRPFHVFSKDRQVDVSELQHRNYIATRMQSGYKDLLMSVLVSMYLRC